MLKLINMRRNIFSLGAAILSILSVGNVWALNGTKPRGTGGTYDPFQITKVSELLYFADYVNTENGRANATLYCDLDLTGVNWVPIGTADAPYRGHFDGQGYVLKNLTVNGNYRYCGLFGMIQNESALYNIVLQSPRVTSQDVENADAAFYTGSLCGYSENSKITNVTVINPQVKGKNYVGGVAGCCLDAAYRPGGHASGNFVCIEDCEVIGGSVQGECTVGGIVGRISDAYGQELLNSARVTGQEQVGGIVGVLDARSLLYCENQGAVSGQEAAGGLVGMANRAVELIGSAHFGTLPNGGGAALGRVVEHESDTEYEVRLSNVTGVGSRMVGNAEKVNETHFGYCVLLTANDKRLASGEVAYYMMQGTNDKYWGQRIDVDPRPMLKSREQVYQVKLVDCMNDESVEMLYTNEGLALSECKQHHDVVLVPVSDVTCTQPGVKIAYYHCNNCGHDFEDDQYNDLSRADYYWSPDWYPDDYLIQPQGHSFGPDGKCTKCGEESRLVTGGKIDLGEVEYQNLYGSYLYTYYRYHTDVAGVLTIACSEEDVEPELVMFSKREDSPLDWYEIYYSGGLLLSPGDYYFGVRNTNEPGAYDGVTVDFNFVEQPALHHFDADGHCSDEGCDARLQVVDGYTLQDEIVLTNRVQQFYGLKMPINNGGISAGLNISAQSHPELTEEGDCRVWVRVYDEDWFLINSDYRYLYEDDPIEFTILDLPKDKSYYVTFFVGRDDWDNPEIEDDEVDPFACYLRLGIFCPEGAHKTIKHEGKPVTCDEEGVMDYYECVICGVLFHDEDGSVPFEDEVGGITDVANIDLTLPKGHHYDLETHRCVHCGASNIGTFYVDLKDHWNGEQTEPSGYDLMKFVAPLSGKLEVWTEGGLDTYGSLYDGEDWSLLNSDDDSAEDYNFRIEYEVEAGKTYWIGVRTYNGNSADNVRVRIRMEEYSRFDLNDDETVNVVDVISSLTSGEIPDLNNDGIHDEQDVEVLINLILGVTVDN